MRGSKIGLSLPHAIVKKQQQQRHHHIGLSYRRFFSSHLSTAKPPQPLCSATQHQRQRQRRRRNHHYFVSTTPITTNRKMSSSSSTTQPPLPLPPLSASEHRIYNHMAVGMEAYHSHFRQTWNLLYAAAQSGKRPQGMSIRQFLSRGSDFLRHLEMHHGIEEHHIFPHLAKRMPEFAPAADKKKKSGGQAAAQKKKKEAGAAASGAASKCEEEERGGSKKNGEEEEEVEVEELGKKDEDEEEKERGGNEKDDNDDNDNDQLKKDMASGKFTPDQLGVNYGQAFLLEQHKQIHKGMEGLETLIRKILSGENELDLSVMKQQMDTWGEVLWSHLDKEVETLGAENMRRYWTVEEMKVMPF